MHTLECKKENSLPLSSSWGERKTYQTKWKGWMELACIGWHFFSGINDLTGLHNWTLEGTFQTGNLLCACIILATHYLAFFPILNAHSQGSGFLAVDLKIWRVKHLRLVTKSLKSDPGKNFWESTLDAHHKLLVQ